MLYHSLHFLLARFSNFGDAFTNSPFLVLLQLVDPNVLDWNDESSFTLLHDVVNLADPFDYSTHVN
jgi:hypothetical protein